MPPLIPNESGRLPEATAFSAMQAGEAEVRWRPSRHARRLLTLALAGLLFAMLTRRPELAGMAAPALLLLAAGYQGRPSRIGVRVRLTASRLYEGELAAVDVAVVPGDGAASGAASDDTQYDTRWTLQAGRGVEPASATFASGAAARFTFTIPRWGRRPLGSVSLVLHDRWRLAEGRVLFWLPAR